ncbi:hypothetical protein RIF29_28853 [Crotalaria pallida]|uniref:Uncharacterized protein n=1 Tax=Crotalaria pallida TaxID=3830 RepID=A0AAN9HTC2_CROPI
MSECEDLHAESNEPIKTISPHLISYNTILTQLITAKSKALNLKLPPPSLSLLAPPLSSLSILLIIIIISQTHP